MKALHALLQLSVILALTIEAAADPGFPHQTGPSAGGAEGSPQVESGYVQVEGGRIYFEEAGRGPVVVLNHDGLLHRETWDAQFVAFARSHRVIRWDRRGYGLSDAPRAAFSPLDDLLALLKARKVERATIVGCSAGGLLSLHFTLDHPEMVSGLVLVGPIVSGLTFSDHFLTRGGRGFSRDMPTERKIEYWASTDPWIMAPENAGARQKMKALMAANRRNFEWSREFEQWKTEPALPRLSQIKVPTLIVVGESDMPDVHAHTGVLQTGIIGSSRVVLAHSGHLPALEVPEAFNRTVLEFLKGIK